MSARREPTLLEIAGAWDDLKAAICRTETAQPFQMTAAITALREERERFEDLLLSRQSRKDQAG